MRRCASLFAAIVLLLVANAIDADAHAEIRSSTPSSDGEVAAGVDEVTMRFISFDAEGPVSVEVLDGRGRDHALGETQVVARDSSVTQPTEPLEPGPYRVHWHARSDDGDGTSEGEFTFTVVTSRDDSANIVLLWAAAALVPIGFIVAHVRLRRSTGQGGAPSG